MFKNCLLFLFLFVSASSQELDPLEIQYLDELQTQQQNQLIKDELNRNVGKEFDGKIF
jgi:hypothetical protein